ncbi:hypothetical protein OPV22_020512 [Ensete ventricosum]|uniref:Uncharacterized protein n=1 Tax=Ensete ventricosum TaxID=4639 RepID=A0AAV8QN89_ENSVE|nr:hypothetical protein OPV22_020512 [Ensete ventricosum]
MWEHRETEWSKNDSTESVGLTSNAWARRTHGKKEMTSSDESSRSIYAVWGEGWRHRVGPKVGWLCRLITSEPDVTAETAEACWCRLCRLHRDTWFVLVLEFNL